MQLDELPASSCVRRDTSHGVASSIAAQISESDVGGQGDIENVFALRGSAPKPPVVKLDAGGLSQLDLGVRDRRLMGLAMRRRKHRSDSQRREREARQLPGYVFESFVKLVTTLVFSSSIGHLSQGVFPRRE